MQRHLTGKVCILFWNWRSGTLCTSGEAQPNFSSFGNFFSLDFSRRRNNLYAPNMPFWMGKGVVVSDKWQSLPSSSESSLVVDLYTIKTGHKIGPIA